METWQNLLWVGGGLLAVLLVSLLPLRFSSLAAFLGINAVAGLAVLTLVNLFAASTQLFLPLNTVTVAVSSILGVPGMVALTVLALL